MANIINDIVLSKHFKDDIESIRSSSSTSQFYRINKSILLNIKPYQIIDQINHLSKYNFVTGYKWLLRIWSGQIPFNWRQNNKRKYPCCIWCNNPWTNFLSHVFTHCKILKKIRVKHNLCTGWKKNLKIDNKLLSTVKFLDEIFKLPCVAVNNW